MAGQWEYRTENAVDFTSSRWTLRSVSANGNIGRLKRLTTSTVACETLDVFNKAHRRPQAPLGPGCGSIVIQKADFHVPGVCITAGKRRDRTAHPRAFSRSHLHLASSHNMQNGTRDTDCRWRF